LSAFFPLLRHRFSCPSFLVLFKEFHQKPKVEIKEEQRAIKQLFSWGMEARKIIIFFFNVWNIFSRPKELAEKRFSFRPKRENIMDKPKSCLVCRQKTWDLNLVKVPR
jgi:hypothetical protein